MWAVFAIFLIAVMLVSAGSAWFTFGNIRDRIEHELLTSTRSGAVTTALLLEQAETLLDMSVSGEHPHGWTAPETGRWVAAYPAGSSTHAKTRAPPISPEVEALVAEATGPTVAELSLPFEHNGRWLASLYRAMPPSTPGSPVVVHVVTFDLSPILESWAGLRLLPGAQVRLLQGPRTLWLERGTAPVRIGSDVPGSADVRAVAAAETASGTTRIVTADRDDWSQYVAWARVATTDLFQAITIPDTSVARVWAHEVAPLAVLCVVLLTAAAGVSAYLSRSIAREIDKRQASETKFRDFSELASDWYWETDGEARYTYISERFEAFTGMSTSTMVGQRRETALVDAMTREDWEEHRRALHAHEPFRNVRLQLRNPQGQVRHVRSSGNPVFDADGTFQGYRGTAIDVTDEVEARDKAVAAERRLVQALENIPHAVVLFDADDRYVLGNSRYRETIDRLVPGLVKRGATLEELVREGARRGLYRIPDGDVETFVAKRLADHRNLPSTREHQLGDGRWMHITENRTQDGGCIMTQSDVSDQKLKADALRAARDEAERASRAKSEFLANMSHELRTPLNAILGFAQIMQDELFGELGSTRYREYIDDMATSATHLLGIINDMLDLSKIESGRFEINDEEVDVAALVEECVTLLEPTADERTARFEIEAPEEEVRVSADPRALRQILLNLLSNAVKFSPPDGRVSVGWTVRRSGAFELSVGDQGPGMSQHEIAHALTPFGQLENAMTRAQGGTGLGLPITRSLVELHGGSLRIESRPGAGTTVFVSLPSARILPRRAA